MWSMSGGLDVSWRLALLAVLGSGIEMKLLFTTGSAAMVHGTILMNENSNEKYVASTASTDRDRQTDEMSIFYYIRLSIIELTTVAYFLSICPSNIRLCCIRRRVSVRRTYYVPTRCICPSNIRLRI
jgi:hypothetical protein